MSEQQPEDFTGESEVDDSTQLAQRRRVTDAVADDSTQLSQRRQAVDAEPDDATQLGTRRRGEVALEDSTQLAERRRPLVEADLDEETRMALRRADGLTSADAAPVVDDQEDDVTRVASRRAETQGDTMPSLTKSSSNENTLAVHPRTGRELPPLPPGQAPIGMRAHEGGFGERTAAYRPRVASATSPRPDLPPATVGEPAQSRQPVLAPADAQRRRESVHRASVGKAIAIGIAVLVMGSAAVVGIVLLMRGLL